MGGVGLGQSLMVLRTKISPWYIASWNSSSSLLFNSLSCRSSTATTYPPATDMHATAEITVACSWLQPQRHSESVYAAK
jgi:hypothetical protein